MELSSKLAILADATKYDASSASSGGQKRASRPGGTGIGSVEGSGICHSYAPDGIPDQRSQTFQVRAARQGAPAQTRERC
jgi:predicted DNA-binding helix-hairpin-helix protein